MALFVADACLLWPSHDAIIRYHLTLNLYAKIMLYVKNMLKWCYSLKMSINYSVQKKFQKTDYKLGFLLESCGAKL